MKPFKFKQFTIHQDRCAMKVGTDGVLLGAWTSLENHPKNILDVGAGTGLLALQMAQRSQAETIDAIELNANAYEQCVENFEASVWADRLFCYHASFQEFVEEMDESYDLILSNPPFYTENVSSGNPSRDNARQNETLPFRVLIEGVHRLLSDTGEFALIIPKTEEKNVMDLAKEKGLFPNKVLRVRGNPTAPIKRSLIQFSFSEKEVSRKELVIETKRHTYTEAYSHLTKAFYLKM
ncbi:methyltransferase [Muricauda sp. SCSIO 64092]|uniref:tRNA1(Val) (adenine(37)-N6)-methyltransferase n=1 Tax=Allomuricauda sp. SCSIO 64092 TaxID=2908842 RepID=UPI001FF3A0ED|nr:methyltransferase [Muricauda sp. SCSIO 64092]UOY08249.1 methyltransferase [Muricauda sp. SCSIO 64092]